jgi:predicted Abi (CAAX) family protease
MIRLLQQRLHSLRIATTTMPDREAWLHCGLLFGASSALALAFGWKTRLLECEPLDARWPVILALPATLSFFPSLTEELIFRSLLLPHPSEEASERNRSVAALVALTAFVLWHPLQGVTIRPRARPVFQDWRFLAETALLGSTCTAAYYRTGSIWPPVLMHWLTVVAWVLFLGGRRVALDAE